MGTNNTNNKFDMTIGSIYGDENIIIKGIPNNNIGTPQKEFTNTLFTFQSKINQGVINGDLERVSLPNEEDEVASDKSLFGVVNPDTLATLDSRYKYVVVSGSEDPTNTQTASIHANNTTANDNVTIIGGNQAGFLYYAGDESGTIYNTTGKLTFSNYHKMGNWTIKTADGDADIFTTGGTNSIDIHSGNATINSRGQDSISVNIDDNSSQYYSHITLGGANSTISAGQGTSIIDLTSNNIINTHQNTTVNAGSNGTITFTGTNNDTSNSNTVQGGLGNTITSKNTNITAIHGNNNSFTNIDQDLLLLNGVGNTNVSISQQFIGFGANGLNLTLTSNDDNQTTNQSSNAGSLFVADQGNETLNASGYNNTIAIYANTVSGAQSNFTAKGGTGNDILAAGTGDSFFTGGAGDNLFAFTKQSVSNGSTTITDFSRQGSDNRIGLYGYGYDNDSIAQLLNNSHDDNAGNAVLNLENHKIFLEGVSVADLKVSQFAV